MSGTLAICVLGFLCVSLLAVLVYREHRHEAERAELLDRIAAPDAAAARAFQTLAGVDPVVNPEHTDAEDDRRYGVDLPPDEDLIHLYATEREGVL